MRIQQEKQTLKQSTRDYCGLHHHTEELRS